ncbi:MAG: hypothetical protein M1817_003810 [Caeruleum heppii]|nr:MAG: hypothetical protein M1817_003810 [Caeruleum heppii]
MSEHNDHGSGHSSLSSSGTAGAPSNPYMQSMYWAVIGAVVAFATAVNIFNTLLARQRVSAARKGTLTPAKPKHILIRIVATITAVVREISNTAVSTPVLRSIRLRLPPLGKVTIVLANLVVLIVFCFYKIDIKDQWQWEDVGYRTGYITLCQLPLIFLLAGKNNVIGLLIGSSYERLNWLHRWTSRCFLLTSTLHLGYWFTSWARYDYISERIKADSITKNGLIAWGVLVWITFSSMTPIRGWRYEIFVLQHAVSFIALLICIHMHVPARHQVWIWVPVGIVAADRLIRFLGVVYHNLSIFHPRRPKAGSGSRFWACEAEMTPLSHNTTRVTINDPTMRWKPGQHVFFSCNSVMPGQSHPFTIASLPSDGKMEFLVHAKKGFTGKVLHHAEKGLTLPTSEPSSSSKRFTTVAVEGPYGRIRPLEQFDSVIFFAGSTGATFTVPLLRDLARRWQPAGNLGTAARYIRFVWVIKGLGQLSWFESQLTAVSTEVEDLRRSGRDVKMEMSVYITCDPSFTEEGQTRAQTACRDGGKCRPTEEQRPVTPSAFDEKKLPQETITETSSTSDSPSPPRQTCGPNGTCCCTDTIVDEADAITGTDAPAKRQICNCLPGGCSTSAPENPKRSSSSTTEFTFQKTPPSLLSNVHDSIHLLSGRPSPYSILSTALEQARGESAVVVCGPSGLVNDVRGEVVRLSDERAVHKGTGAQGVWLHCEAFGW